MRSIAVAFICVSGTLSLLRSGSIPWRLVSKEELDALVTAQAQSVAAAGRDRDQPANRPFYAVPGYRTALEKTTVIGVPEASRSREWQRDH